MPRSNANELIGGFTHWKLIGVEEVIANATATTTSLVSAIGIPKGAIVKDVAVHGVERWTDNVAQDNTIFSVEVGDGDDPDGFITSYDYFETSASTGVTKWNNGVYFRGTDSAGATTSNVVNGKLYDSADTIDVLFTADSDISLMNGGLLFVGAVILDPSAYNPS